MGGAEQQSFSASLGLAGWRGGRAAFAGEAGLNFRDSFADSLVAALGGDVTKCGQYHSHEGLTGSHYSGLQFRGARDLLDEHGDASIGIFAEGDRVGEAAVHGAASSWMEWRGQKDISQRRVNLRFTNNSGPLHWFVRRGNPLAALPFQYEHDLSLAPGAAFTIDHTLTFTDL